MRSPCGIDARIEIPVVLVVECSIVVNPLSQTFSERWVGHISNSLLETKIDLLSKKPRFRWDIFQSRYKIAKSLKVGGEPSINHRQK